MFTKSARFYDAIYSFKDYASEVVKLREIISSRKADARSLLDVACGTGLHLEHLRRDYTVEGVDLDPALLAIARDRLGDVLLHEGDMRTFDLGRTFDVVTCLFSSIGYVQDEGELVAALTRMAAHLRPDGILIVEPWFGPEEWEDGHLAGLFVDEPDLKIARMNIASSRGRTSIVDFHYLVGTHEDVSHFTELHELRLFTRDEYLSAFAAAGLEVEHDPEGLMGRGLYVATRTD